MTVNVVCSKKMKHSTKVAEGIANAMDFKLIDMEEIPNIKDVDLLIIVSGGSASREKNSGIDGYISRLPENRVKHAGIITLDSNFYNRTASRENDISGCQIRLKKILKEKNIEVLGEHMCLSGYYIFCIGHPNRKDINKSIDWVENIVKFCK